MQKSKIKIAIADDHYVCRLGLSSMFDPAFHELVAEAKDGFEIINIVDKVQVDVVFMDIEMPGIDGITATRVIKEKNASVGIIALTMYKDSLYLTKMLDAGALGYLSKMADKKEIFEAIEMVSQHKKYFCKESSKKMTQMIIEKNKHYKERTDLNETELKIVRLLCEEYNSEEIGKILFLSKRTIDGARLRIQVKLNVNSTAGIVKYAITNGIYRVQE